MAEEIVHDECWNLDQGLGNRKRFSADYLEFIYRLGGADPEQRILGKELNKLLNTRSYCANRWYAITEYGIEKR